MFQVSHSPFLLALGYAIINSLWQFGLLWLVYLFTNSVLRLSPNRKYTAAILLQFAGFVWFCGTLLFYYGQSLVHANSLPAVLSVVDSLEHSLSPASSHYRVLLTLLQTEQFLPYLSIAYLLLLFTLAVRWINSYRYTRVMQITSHSKIDVAYRLFVERLANQLGIKKPVRVYLSTLVNSPLTIGYLKPVILIPFASVNHLNTEQLEAVLLHELAHIKRYDYLVNLVLSVIEVTLFFNPFMQLLSRHIKRERENSCDDWVLQYEYNAATYAKALLQLASCHTRTASFAMNAADRSQTLLIRVKRMIEKKDRSLNYRNQLFALLLISGALSSVAWLTPNALAKSVTIQAQPEGDVTRIAEPLVASINNPLFNPVFFLTEKKQIELQENLHQVVATELKKVEHVQEKMVLHSKKINQVSLTTPELLPALPKNYFDNELNKMLVNAAPFTSLQWKFDSIYPGSLPVRVLYNEREDLIILNRELRQLNTLLQGKNVVVRAGTDASKMTREVEKALSEIKDLATPLLKKARVIVMAEGGQKRSEIQVKVLNELLEKQEIELLFEEGKKHTAMVSYTPSQVWKAEESSAGCENKPENITYSTHVEPSHTYSFGYVERPTASVRAVTSPKAKAINVEKVADDNDCTAETSYTTAHAPAVKKPTTRKVIKIVRI